MISLGIAVPDILPAIFKDRSDSFGKIFSSLFKCQALTICPRDFWTISDVPVFISLKNGNKLICLI